MAEHKIAAIPGDGIGIAPTANLNSDRHFPSMFEPIHGSAFDISGTGIANPCSRPPTRAIPHEWN